MAETSQTANAVMEAARFIKIFNTLMMKHASWKIWVDFISMFAAAISNSIAKNNFDERESEYLKTIKQYSPAEQKMFAELCAIMVNALERNPWQDFLGGLYMGLGLNNHWKGQFFTPYSVTQVMSAISMNNIYDRVSAEGYITVNDCACGAGATLIAAAETAYRELTLKHKMNWQNHVMFTAQDIDAVTAKMCYIQLSLLGCAGYIKIGDSLVNPMSNNDDAADYWFTPMYFSCVWQTRRLMQEVEQTIYKKS